MNYDVTPIATGLYRFDTELYRKQLAAAYLAEENGLWAIVETGNFRTAEKILQYFSDHQIALEKVRAIAVTHVHLDHAGGVGRLMQALPEAELLVHARGARHMINPAKLQAGATAVYGEESYMSTYGDLIPVPEERVRVVGEGDRFQLGEREWTFFDTPGHARHHVCIFDHKTKGIFTGDTCGLAYPQLVVDGKPYVMPTTTPVQFDPEAMKTSVDRLFAQEPEYFFLTHYGAVSANADYVSALKSQVDDYVAIAKACARKDKLEQTLMEELERYTLEQLAEHGCSLSVTEQRAVIASDIRLNAQGLAHWLQTA